MTPLFFILIITIKVLSCLAQNPESQEHPIIEIKNGLIRGITQNSRLGRTFYAFKKIPYALPPIGNLRFMPPEEAKNWTGILNTQTDPPSCIQKNYLFGHNYVEGDEDCLYLNVFSPKLRARRRTGSEPLLPVMVFIHWGGFFTGSSRTDYLGPEYFMDKNIILVTFNYRLGVLGFLSTNDDEAPGNYGLKDQVMALQWVQKNIEHFGGNKNKVTIFGQSAGGASVHFHMLSPLSKGLFHQAISQSGSALALWAAPFSSNQGLIAQKQGELVGCKSKSTKDLVNCLRKVEAYDLVKSGDKFKFFSIDPLTVYKPNIEKKTNKNLLPFMTKMPVDYIQDKEFQAIPWIISVVQDEGLLRAESLIRHDDLRIALNKKFDSLLPELIGLSLSTQPKNITGTWEMIKKYYFHDRSEINPKYPQTLKGLINLYTDRFFLYSSFQTAAYHNLKGHKKIWFLNFNYTGQYSYGNLFAGTGSERVNYPWGVSHCDDLLYLFKSSGLFKGLNNKNDKFISDALISYYTNFATYGTPSPDHFKSYSKWEPFSNSNLNDCKNFPFLNIEGSFKQKEKPSIKMELGLYSYRQRFWELIPLMENIAELNQTHIDL